VNPNTEVELLDVRRRLLAFAESYDEAPETKNLNAIWKRANEIGQNASGSWLGYHANVYYEGFQHAPAGIHFGVDNGTFGTYYSGPDRN